MPRLLLHSLQSEINIGMILRVAETYQIDVLIHDAHGVFQDTSRVDTVADFACGALERRPPTFVPFDDASRLTQSGTRSIATTIVPPATPLPGFTFQDADVIALGNEYDGLPPAFVSASSVRLYIPMANVWTPKPPSRRMIDPSRRTPVARDGMPNLNVAIAAGIIAFEIFQQSQQAAP